MDKLLKAVWFLTLFAITALLLYVYAGFFEGQEVVVFESFSLDKEHFFFSTLVLIMLYNFTFYTIQWRFRNRNTDVQNFIKGWLMGLAATMNFFLFVVLGFIQVRNGGEHFDYSNFGYLIYAAVGAIVIWTLVLPVYLVVKKK